MGTKVFLGFVLGLAITDLAGATILSDAIAQMQPGTFQVIKPTNQAVITNLINVYGDSMSWDSLNHKLIFNGSYHAAPGQNIIYDEATNSYRTGSQPPTETGNLLPNIWGHGYDLNTADNNGNSYYRIDDKRMWFIPGSCTPIGSCPQEWKYNVATDSWTSLPNSPFHTPANTCCEAWAYFADLNSLFIIYATSDIGLFNLETQTWSQIPTPAGWFGSSWQFAEYDSVHHLMLFGNSTGLLFMMEASGQITRLSDVPPSPAGPMIYDGSGWTSNVTSDPISGRFLVFAVNPDGSGNKILWSFDPLANLWTEIGAPPVLNNPPLYMNSYGAISSTPIKEYGVTVTLICGVAGGSCDGRILIYKASPNPPADTSSPVVSILSPNDGMVVQRWSNPF
jgi:hypothetical protein